VILNLSVSFAILPEGQERWFGARIYGHELESRVQTYGTQIGLL